MSTPSKSKRGRPKLGNVLFAKRVHPSKIPAILELLRASKIPEQTLKDMANALEEGGKPIPAPVAVVELAGDVRTLLDDNARLAREIEAYEAKLQKVARMTDNERLAIWIRKYDELKKVYDLRVGGSVYSQ